MGNETKTLWVSIIAGLFSAFLLYSYSQEKKAEWDKKFGATKRVVVAATDILEMQTIDDSMLNVTERPAEFIEPGALTDVESAVGQVAATPIKKGEQVLNNKLLTPGPDTGLSLQIAPDKRAVTLPIDEVRASGKLIRPGDRVDVVVALDIGKGVAQKREVRILMSSAIVLATGVNVLNNIPRTFEVDGTTKNVTQVNLNGDTRYTSVTIEASPKEAQDLIYILSTSPGNIFLTLRNPNDKTSPNLTPTSAETIGGTRVYSQFETPSNTPGAMPVQNFNPNSQRIPASAPSQNRPQSGNF